jgi:hypothetical protein
MMRSKSATVVLAPEERTAWARLQRARPNVEWHKASLRSADFLGDGSLTRVMVGNDEGGAGFIGLAHPGREGAHNPGVFEVGAHIGLAFEKIERAEDWLFQGVFPLEGCRPRRGKSMLRVVDNGTQTQTLFYWHSEARRFAAWSTSLSAPQAEPEAWADESITG